MAAPQTGIRARATTEDGLRTCGATTGAAGRTGSQIPVPTLTTVMGTEARNGELLPANMTTRKVGPRSARERSFADFGELSRAERRATIILDQRLGALVEFSAARAA
jgi:hypothetical protein